MIIITTGFSVSRHFCHDRLVKTEFFSAVQSCHAIKSSCCGEEGTSSCGNNVKQGDCCKNQNDLVKFNQPFTVSQKYNPEKHQFSIFSLILPDFHNNVSFTSGVLLEQLKIGKPPTLSEDILKLIHSFLI